MRVADYIAEFFVKHGIKSVFLVSGGGMMHLLDGLACNKNLEVVCTHHEQAAAMAGIGYAKLSEGPAVVYLTTGCGSTNAITGLLDAWQDSVPVIFVSGQSKRKESIRGSRRPLRQFGVQEVDIIPIVSSLTKYSVFLEDPRDTRRCLERAWHEAVNGRPGPVWIDVPLDVQASGFSEDEQRLYLHGDFIAPSPSQEDLSHVASKLAEAKRPMLLIGQGVRLAKAGDLLRRVAEKHDVPVVTSRLGLDALSTDHPLYVGRIGNKGDRAGNFAIQNADFVLAIGSRLSVSSTGHEYEKFARQASLVVVDIDPSEHEKDTVRIDRFIRADAAEFLRAMSGMEAQGKFSDWVLKCCSWRDKFSVFLPRHDTSDGKVNVYRFMEELNALLPKDAVVVSDAGSSFYVVSQSVSIGAEQRYVTSGGQADMGFGLAAAIGASVARNKKDVVAVVGDGSFQMNIQELQTVVHYDLPLKIFVWNNDGYLSIRSTQNRFFEGRLLGTDKTSGVSFPSLEKIAFAYGLEYRRIARTSELKEGIEGVLSSKGAVLCEVVCLPNQDILTVSSTRLPDGRMVSKPLEDMYPFLSREDFLAEMIVDPLPDSR